MPFAALGLAPELLRAVADEGYAHPTPIQSEAIPLALADAASDGRLKPGKLVLMTGMGAGLTWGSALIEWTHDTNGAGR